jgi:hypothetical protein
MPASVSTAKGASAASKAANTANIISAVGDVVAQVGGTVATVIGGITNEKLRRQFSQNLELLTLEQKKALDAALLDVSSEAERQKLVAKVLTDLSLKRIDVITSDYNNKGKAARTNIIVAASIFGVIAIGIIAIIVLKKK